jgi:NADH:ubiquinone oxidoreductase subunit K
MPEVPLEHWLVASTLLFALGVYAVVGRQNAIAILLGIEMMFASANVNLLAFWRYRWVESLEAPVFVTIIILVAACELAVALAIVLSVFRTHRSVDVETLDTMQG